MFLDGTVMNVILHTAVFQKYVKIEMDCSVYVTLIPSPFLHPILLFGKLSTSSTPTNLPSQPDFGRNVGIFCEGFGVLRMVWWRGEVVNWITSTIFLLNGLRSKQE